MRRDRLRALLGARPAALRVALAAPASGVLLWLASPAGGLGDVAWVALVPAAAVHLRDPESRAGRAVVPLAYLVYLELVLVPALPFGVASGQWGEPVLPILVADSPAVAAALLGAPLLCALLYLVRFPQPWPAMARSGVAAVAVPALAWAALDLVRTRYDPSGLWGPLFASQHEAGLLPAAALAGPLLLTALIVAVNFTLALLLVRGRGAVTALAAVGAAALAAALGTLALPAPGGERVTVSAVQPGYDTTEFERRPVRHFHPRRRNLARASLEVVADLARPSREAAARGAELLAWPEAAVWAHPARHGSLREALLRLVRESGAAVLVPYFRASTGSGAVLAVLPDGSLTSPAPKQRPMWFLGERAEGVPPSALPVGEAAAGVLLGVDNQAASSARTLALGGATVLVSSTHDWRELAEQQRALARLNAAAVRLPLVRADWRYGSAILDARGRTLADAGLGRARTALLATVAARASDAPYLAVGDLLGWIGLVLFAALRVGALAAGTARGWARRRGLSGPRAARRPGR